MIIFQINSKGNVELADDMLISIALWVFPNQWRTQGGGFKPPKKEKSLYKNNVISEDSIYSNKISQK